MTLDSRIKGIILVIIGGMLWGVSGTVAQYLFKSEGFAPEWLVVIRLLLSGFTLITYIFIKSEQNIWEIWKDKNDRVRLILFSIVGMLGVQYTCFCTIKYANAATATILQYLSPIIITCYMVIKNKKMPTLQEGIAIGLAMIGTYFIITNGSIHNISISTLALFWGFVSAITAAFYTLQPHSLIIKWGSLTVVAWSMVIGGIALSFVEHPWVCTGRWSISSILAILFVVLFGTLVAFSCFLESLKYINPSEVSILSSSEPLSAALLSVFWLHEHLGVVQMIGIFCIILTIAILSKTNNKLMCNE